MNSLLYSQSILWSLLASLSPTDFQVVNPLGLTSFISALVQLSTRPTLHWLSQLLHHEKVEQHCGMENVRGFNQEHDRDKRSCIYSTNIQQSSLCHALCSEIDMKW